MTLFEKWSALNALEAIATKLRAEGGQDVALEIVMVEIAKWDKVDAK